MLCHWQLPAHCWQASGHQVHRSDENRTSSLVLHGVRAETPCRHLLQEILVEFHLADVRQILSGSICVRVGQGRDYAVKPPGDYEACYSGARQRQRGAFSQTARHVVGSRGRQILPRLDRPFTCVTDCARRRISKIYVKDCSQSDGNEPVNEVQTSSLHRQQQHAVCARNGLNDARRHLTLQWRSGVVRSNSCSSLRHPTAAIPQRDHMPPPAACTQRQTVRCGRESP